jgi:HAE1 family hydrophobic/amphiphilic exporter-1
LEQIQLPEGYKFDFGGGAEMMQETVSEMMIAVILAIVLTYMLLAALLEHLVQPLIILITVPLGLIGVLLALVFTGKSLSIISMLAIIMLIGIVVNNAILMLDYSNQLVRENGLSHKLALIKAAPVKLRPILMSTISIMLGMLPMAMGWGDKGAEMRQPMGIVQIGGLLASTLLCLFIVPALDYLVDEFYQFIKRLFSSKRKKPLVEPDGKAKY